MIWAHNSHIGDARVTEMTARGELNIRQLMRERHGRDAVNVGFTTDTGTVTAASEWGGPAERKRVRAALADSCETLFHRTHLETFLLCPVTAGQSGRALRDPPLHRAIGVIYRLETECQSHLFAASAAQQYGALIHLDSTRAVQPLERTPTWDLGEPPETYPTALCHRVRGRGRSGFITTPASALEETCHPAQATRPLMTRPRVGQRVGSVETRREIVRFRRCVRSASPRS